MGKKRDKFLQYGISNELADKARSKDLTVSDCRSLSQTKLNGQYGMTVAEAKELKKCLVRQPINKDVIHHLLSSSNYLCNACKGKKGHSYVIHHIEPYEESQNNDYYNLIVLCPNDHDQAHSSGLTNSISREELIKLKRDWEAQVERENVQSASKSIDIDTGSIDYVNAQRIEEICLNNFGDIPATERSESLKEKGILSADGMFDEQHVRKHITGGRYLFDYLNAGETHHYRELMRLISKDIELIDLDENLSAASLKNKSLEGRYAYFVGGVSAKWLPQDDKLSAPLIDVKYKRRNFHIQWFVNSDYLVSSTSHSRLSGNVRYIIYCQIKSIDQHKLTRQWLIKATPLLIAQPNHYINKKPIIAYVKEQEREAMEDEFDALSSTEFPEDLDDNEFTQD